MSVFNVYVLHARVRHVRLFYSFYSLSFTDLQIKLNNENNL